jgi:hypothetical protein
MIIKFVSAGLIAAAAAPLLAQQESHQEHLFEQVKLTASDGQAGDVFGNSVAMHEDFLVVGAPGCDNPQADTGAVYVYGREGLVDFQEKGLLLAFDRAPGDRFGDAVAVSHDSLVVGAPGSDVLGQASGAAYVFVESGGVWSLQAKLTPADGAAGDHFGNSVDIEGDLIIVGAPGHDVQGVRSNAGAAYVFERAGTTWTELIQLAPLDGDAEDGFGVSVAIGGAASHAESPDHAVIVGASQDSDLVFQGGAAYVFVETAGVWTEEVKLTDANAASADHFGAAVDLLGAMAVVGSPGDDELASDSGSMFVFEESAGVWSQVLHYFGASASPGRQLGSCVAISHAAVIAGAPLDDLGPTSTDSGTTHGVFPEEGWTGDVFAATDAEAGNHFGISVAASGCWTVSGADRDSDLGADSGAVYVHQALHHNEIYCTAGTSASGCQASIGSLGVASASAPSGFALFVDQLEGQMDGMFYFSANGQQAAPWHGSSSFQCVVPPVVRTPLLPGSGTAGQCDGLSFIDLNALWCATCPQPGKNPGEGAILYSQFWYRDPANTSGSSTSLSDAIVVEVCN